MYSVDGPLVVSLLWLLLDEQFLVTGWPVDKDILVSLKAYKAMTK